MIDKVIDGKLARSCRPGYGGERGSPVALSVVDTFLEQAKSFGIQSIICLLHDEHLCLYNEIPGGLIAYYREKGFKVAHIPVLDRQRPPLTPEHLEQVCDAYRALPKPVLVHCSAGMDRTGQAVRHLVELC
jgi:protein tyrosine phosphatase (PTP) superfamily phosphohydrolase (DUF442 family)